MKHYQIYVFYFRELLVLCPIPLIDISSVYGWEVELFMRV